MEVLGNDGSLVTGLSDIINRWEKDFKGLFSSETFDFDGRYYEDLCQRKNVIEGYILKGEYWINKDLNNSLTKEAVQMAINKAKLGKATGVENIPNEILKSPKLFDILCDLFKLVL